MLNVPRLASASKAKKLIKEGINKFLKKSRLTLFDVNWIVVGYRLLDDQQKLDEWETKYKKMKKEKNKAYSTAELLKPEIEEVEL